MLNFDYLKQIPELRELHRLCDLCEQRQNSDPESSAIYARKALEWLVKAIYMMKNLALPERAKLYHLTTSPAFTDFIADPQLMSAVHWVRKVGNLAAHDGKVTQRDAFFTVLNLYNLVGGVLLKLRVLNTLAPFDKMLLPQRQSKAKEDHSADSVSVSEESVQEFATKIDNEIVEQAPEVSPNISWGDISEAETRRRFIDLMLREAGWEVLETEGDISPSKACIEVKVEGMPNNSGKGYADYVLFGADGKPLAVIEAKRTSRDAEAGKHQAELYADCLEKRYKVRPVIYYTNGFEIHMIYGLGYPPRRLYAFHTEKDLKLIVSRRATLQDIKDFTVKEEITDRHYLLVGEGGKTFTVNIEDEITDGGEVERIDSAVTYKEKVLDFLANNRNLPVLQKIQNIERLTNADIDEMEKILWQELGTKEDYERYLKRENLTADIPVAAFIRKVSGLDRRKAVKLFTDFISANTLTAEQEEFINNILNYVCQNGDMERQVFVSNRIFREALLKYFPTKAAQVAHFVALLHDAITAA